MMTDHELNEFARELRKATLYCLYSDGAGHIGGTMSIAELLSVLYNNVMKIDPKNPKWEERDRLVLSKGHCGPGLMACLALKGYFPVEDLKTLNKPGTHYPSHCDKNLTPGIDMTTGSLGQGTSLAMGLATGFKLQHKDNYVYLIIGDGESQEGQVWEAALYASTKKLNNVIAFTDYNKKQLDGFTKDICDLGDLRAKYEAFGWYAQECDGHDVRAIQECIERAKAQTEKPSMIVLHTVKAKDCNFAEGVYYNHHVTISKEQYESAVAALDAMEVK
jgi:transketolase